MGDGMRVLVTPRSLTSSPHPAVQSLAAQGFEVVTSPAGKLPGEADLLRLLPGCAGWIAGVEPVSAAVIAGATDLRVISRNGTGTDNLPLDAVRQRGITVRTAGGANAAGVAELAIGLMFAGLRHIPAADSGIKAGGWPRRRGREIRGCTVGVVGCGAIGREVARLCAGLGAQVLGFDPIRPEGVPADRFAWAELAAIFARADILTLHCPAQGDGSPLVDAAALAAMPAGGIVVNTARASLVDEGAILRALDAGHLAAYATDVFAEEPPRSLTLAGHRGVIATSHIGALTMESVARAAEIAVANLIESLLASAETKSSRAG